MMWGPPSCQSPLDPRPQMPRSPRLGAELARGAQRGTPSGEPLAGAAELAGRAGLPGEGPPNQAGPPPPLRRAGGGGRGSGRTTPERAARGGAGPGWGRRAGRRGGRGGPRGYPGPSERGAPASGKWPLRRGAESAPRPPPGALNLEPGGRPRSAPRRAGPGACAPAARTPPPGRPRPRRRALRVSAGRRHQISALRAPGPRASVAALEGSGVRSARVGGVRVRGVRLGTPGPPNRSARESDHAFAGLCVWAVPSLSVGPWVPRRRVLSFMCLCVSAHPRGWVCCGTCVLEHCEALGQCVCVFGSLGDRAVRPCAVNGTAKLWLPACPRRLDVPG